MENSDWFTTSVTHGWIITGQKEWVRTVSASILSLAGVTSVRHDFCTGGPLLRCCLTTCSLFCVCTYIPCALPMCSEIFLKKIFRSSAGITINVLPMLSLAVAANWSAKTFSYISRCPGTQHTTTCCLSAYAAHTSEWRETRMWFLRLFRVFRVFPMLREYVYIIALCSFVCSMCFTAVSTRWASAVKMLVLKRRVAASVKDRPTAA